MAYIKSYLKKLILISFIISQMQVTVSLGGVYDDGDEYDDPPKIKTPVYALDRSTDLVSTKKIVYSKPRIVVKSVYPQLQSTNVDEDEEEDENIANFNRLIDGVVQETIDDFTNFVRARQDIQKSMQRSVVKNSLYTDYDTSVIKTKGHRIISLRFTIKGTLAGIHYPYRLHRVLNYNLDDSQMIELDDLFKPDSDYLDILSDYCHEQLSKRLPNKSMIDNGTTPILDHFKNWNIKSNGLLITFDENQVAPPVLGAQTVFIPYSVLRKVIASDSPIYDCVKNKRRCARNSLLTGGFIDEAYRTTHHKILASK